MNSNDIDILYSNPLPSSRTGLFYNTFSYPTKISPETVAIYIAMHTEPGDTVLDIFGGSGSTGLAALMCEHPTERMIKTTEELGITPTWGARNAEIYELGRYGSYASNVLCNPPNEKDFRLAAKEYFKKAHDELDWLYSCKDELGNDAKIRHTVWSDMLICPNCNHEITYYDLFVEHDPMIIKEHGKCPKCSFLGDKDNFDNKLEEVQDTLLNKETFQRKRVPVLIYGQTSSRKWKRVISEDDIDLIKLISKNFKFEDYKPQVIDWGELYRSGYHTGITHLHHFYTQRNFYVMMKLWELTKDYPEKIRDSLRLILLSYNAAHSTLMSRVVLKKNSRDFVLTSAQSGVLYISSLPVEKNIIIGAERKLKTFLNAFKYVNTCSGTVNVVNQSSETLNLNDKTIDYLFTDPPFGDFIPYSEVNQINELWLGEITNKEKEAIISESQNKDLEKYQSMMTTIFVEARRVLKDNSKATVVFHSSKAEVWEAMKQVINSSKFNIVNTSILNKTQATFKQTVSKGSVQGDPVMLIEKGQVKEGTSGQSSSSEEILDKILKESIRNEEINVRLLYSKYITKCLEKGLRVEWSAKEAYNYFYTRIGVEV